MIRQPQQTTAVAADKIPATMKVRFHVYPDARSTSMKRYCSAWSRRYGRAVRPA